MRFWARGTLCAVLTGTVLALACAAGTNLDSAGALEGCSPESAELGRSTFAQCSVCHSLNPELGHGAGPNLAGVIGRPIGKSDGFRFSPVMRESSGSWSVEELDRFLANPQVAYPGLRMAYAGLPDPKRRKDLICYLAAPPPP